MHKSLYHHLSWLNGVEILEAEFRAHAFGSHSHEGFAIGSISTGVGGYRFRGANVTLPTGSLSLMNPDEAHTGHAASGTLRYTMLYASEDAVRAVLDYRVMPAFSEIAAADRDGALGYRLAMMMQRLRASKGPDWRLGLEEGVRAVLETAFVRHGGVRLRPAGDEPRMLVEMRERIAAAVEEGRSPSLAELAAGAGLHPCYLIRCVRRSTGLTPHALVIQRRIQRARAELLAGMPAAECAVALGFSDQSHLIRQFRRHYGVPPGAIVRH